MQHGERRASVVRIAVAGDQGMLPQPAMQGVPQASFALPVHDPHRAFAAHEGALDERLGRCAGLVPTEGVQVGLRDVAARFGQEEQAFERFGA